MQILGRTERRVVSAILVTALIPLVASILIARAVIQRVSAAAFQPEFSAHLHRALGVYRELAASIKQGMRYEADAIASSEALRRAAERRDEQALAAELEAVWKAHPALVSIDIESCQGGVLASRNRGTPVDPTKERALTVRRAVGGGEADEGCDGDAQVSARLTATFVTPRERFDELESIQEFAATYDEFARAHREQYLDRTYRNVFAVLLGFTILLAVVAGILVVRPVTIRIARLAAATRPVAEGDLSVRVEDRGRDEVADLGRAFNRMLEELKESRARIEFLKRIGEWQKIARRLAHEIKNPLTPIQLAVEECHRRYPGDNLEYKRILETTLEVVAEEVGSLRRLVSEFASFARLPHVELAPADLGEFLREQRGHFAVSGGTGAGTRAGEAADEARSALAPGVGLSFDISPEPMPAFLDREMMHRVLSNILQNAAQAISGGSAGTRGEGERLGQVRVSARGEGDDGAYYVLDFDDDGPGVPPELRPIVFDPYVSTRREGTGLGLSIVKKIIVEHGGTIDVDASPLGGARFRVRVPRAGTPQSNAVVERAPAPPSEPSWPGYEGQGGPQ